MSQSTPQQPFVVEYVTKTKSGRRCRAVTVVRAANKREALDKFFFKHPTDLVTNVKGGAS